MVEAGLGSKYASDTVLFDIHVIFMLGVSVKCPFYAKEE